MSEPYRCAHCGLLLTRVAILWNKTAWSAGGRTLCESSPDSWHHSERDSLGDDHAR